MARTLNDYKYTYLGVLGYTGALEDREQAWRSALGYGRGSLYEVYKAAGYSGSLNDMAYAFFANPFPLWLPTGAAWHVDFANQQYYEDGASTTDLAITQSAHTGGLKTVTDSDGLLKWNGHNLLTYSEDFSNAAWTKTNATLTAGITAPDESLTATA